MSDFKQYRRTQIAEMTPWVEGFDMRYVSVSVADTANGSPKPGGMIARNPKCHTDQWLVAAQYFADNFAALSAPQADAEAVVWRIRVVDGSYCKVIPDGELEAWKQNWSRHLQSGHAVLEPLGVFGTPPPSQSAQMRELIDRYTLDIVKNAMLTMWNDICADTDCHPLDIEHGRGKRLTFTPQHWAEAAGKMVRQNILDLIRADDGTKYEGGRELTGQEQKCVEAALLASGTVVDELRPVDVEAIADIVAERRRQREAEGWTSEHDDDHDKGEMAFAAACYAAPERIFVARESVGRGYEPLIQYVDAWKWADHWWKPKDRRRDLVRAGALIVAEIERLDRLALQRGGA